MRLVLSVEDKVVFLDGRSIDRRQAEPRWLDAYTVRSSVFSKMFPGHLAGASRASTGGDTVTIGLAAREAMQASACGKLYFHRNVEVAEY